MTIHDNDLTSRLRSMLDGEGDEEDVLVLEYLGSLGVPDDMALRITLRYVMSNVLATPTEIRHIAHEEGIELPTLPFFES